MSELLCHCDGDHLGHELGAGLECPRIRPGRWLRPEIVRIGEYAHINLARVDARGTCPACRRNVRVVRIQVVTADRPDLHPLMPGVTLAGHPGMASHKDGGRTCDGVGQVPLETRYRSVTLEKMIRDFGSDSVERKPA